MQSQQLSTNIKKVCADNNVTVKALLDACGMNKGSIYDLEKRGAFPSVDKIVKIADYLGVSVDYLLGRSDISDDVVPLLNIYSKLSAVDKAKLLVYADGLLNK